MKKFRPLILILVLITAFVLFLILYNPSISIGYYDGVVKNEAKDYPYEGRVGLFIKRTRNKTNKEINCIFSYGYYKEEELSKFHVLIYVNDEVDGMIPLLEKDIEDFYTDEYQVIKPSLFSGDLKYAKYEEIGVDFSKYQKGTIGIYLTCYDQYNQELVINQEIKYEVKGNSVTFKK